MIPEQLKNEEFRFVRLGLKTKKPIAQEKGWRLRGGLKHDDPILLEHIEQSKNYGVSGGYGDLYLLDSDIPLIGELLEQKFGKTFRVRSGSGRGFHDYFIIRNDVLYRTITFDKDGEHFGELRGDGNYVVCPGSIHPSGGTYEVIRNIPILEINYDELIEHLKDYTKPKTNKTVSTEPRKDYGECDIQSISLSTVLGTNENRIANPWHGSTSGKNMVIDYGQGVWHCKRCDAGGGVAQAIGLNEGIISECQDRLDLSQFFEVLEIAREKYGLKTQELKPKTEPRGWALSISITRMAERHNYKKCHKCQTPFKFIESHGFYECPTCNIRGGLKKFAELIAEVKI